eukprot:729360-Pyramimonas_sp.AAC.1
MRAWIARCGDAEFQVQVRPRALSATEWAGVAFEGERLTLLFRGLRNCRARPQPSEMMEARQGGRYGAGVYFTPDPLVALAYTRATRKEALEVPDGQGRFFL